MISRSTSTWLLLLALLLSQGCIVIGSPDVWVEQPDELAFPAQGLEGISLLTKNGAIDVTADASTDQVLVRIVRRAGGETEQDARACLDAIRIVTQTKDLIQDVRWNWDPERQTGWAGEVSYSVVAPPHLTVDLTTHNGRIVVNGVSGDVELKSHNGAIEVQDGAMRTVTAETHNGRLDITAPAEVVQLVTHNGAIRADLRGSRAIEGRIETHNGAVEVNLEPSVSTDLRCRTNNGSITCDLPLSQQQESRGKLSGTLNAGGRDLSIETHNGRIKIVSTDRATRTGELEFR